MKNRSVAEIFNETPGSWGLRGDPYLWEDLKQHFEKKSLPYPANAFREEINDFFEKTSGNKLTKECQVSVAKYAHGGMSGGMLSGAFWLEQAIPLLLNRLEKANQDIQQDLNIFSYEKQARSAGILLIAAGTLFLLFLAIMLALFKPSFSSLIFALNLAIYLPFIAVGITQLYLHAGSIKVQGGCIEYQHGKKTRLIPFHEVERVTFMPVFFQAMKLHTLQGSIWISKDIQGYQQLYKLLAKNIPQLNVVPEGPVSLRAGLFTTFGTGTLAVLLFCALLIFSVDSYMQGSIPLFMLLFMGGLAVFFIAFFIYSMLSKPYQFRLDERGVTECAVLKTKLHPIKSIKTIQFGQIRAKHYTRFRQARMVNYISFHFTDGTYLSIDDQFTNYPIELAVRYVEKVFGITPTYRIIPTP